MPQQDALPPNVMNAVGAQPAGPGPGGPAPGLGGPDLGAPGGPGADQPPPEAMRAMEAVAAMVPDIVRTVLEALIGGPGPGGPGAPAGPGPGGPGAPAGPGPGGPPPNMA